MNRLKFASLLLLAGVSSGCYVQQPLENPIPSPSTRIVAQVTDSGAVAVGNRLGPGAVEVEGVVSTANESAWNLNLLRVSYRGGTSSTWNRELVTFPRFALSNATERRVNKTRSWLMAGLIGAGAILASQLFSEFSSGEGDDPDPTPQNTRTLPLRF
jgi:hypothetical protein